MPFHLDISKIPGLAVMWALWLALAWSASASTVGEIQVSYDLYGGVQSVETPAGGTVDYSFNRLGAPSTVTYTSPAGATENAIAGTSFDVVGNPLSRNYGTGDVATYAWDPLGRPDLIQMHLGTSRPAYRARDFEYDEWGFVSAYTREDRLFLAPLRFEYQYSEQGQLETFQMGPSRRADYSYDAAGNLLARSGFGYGSLTLPPLAPTVYNLSNQRSDWQYDGAGRLVQDDTYRYRYNAAGRLALITEAESGEVVSHYLYDSSGFRVRTLEDERVTYHFRDASGAVIGEEVREPSGELIETRDFVSAGSQALLQAKHLEDGTEELEYRFIDRMGNPVVRWGLDGTPKYQEYSPYGHAMRQASFEPGAHGFTGHEDDATGLTYMRARYYDAGTSRFLQPDPARAFSPHLPSTFNLYGYSFGNPVNLTDPTGKIPVALIPAAVGAVKVARVYFAASSARTLFESGHQAYLNWWIGGDSRKNATKILADGLQSAAEDLIFERVFWGAGKFLKPLRKRIEKRIESNVVRIRNRIRFKRTTNAIEVKEVGDKVLRDGNRLVVGTGGHGARDGSSVISNPAEHRKRAFFNQDLDSFGDHPNAQVLDVSTPSGAAEFFSHELMEAQPGQTGTTVMRAWCFSACDGPQP